MCLQYFVLSAYMQNGGQQKNKNKYQRKTKPGTNLGI